MTYVYHLFPNVTVAVLSNHTIMTISEPLTPTQTRFVTYRLTNAGEGAGKDNVQRAKRDAGFVADSGGKEDTAAIRAIQAGLDSGANEHFIFGHYEKAIVHFHEVLSTTLQGLPGQA